MEVGGTNEEMNKGEKNKKRRRRIFHCFAPARLICVLLAFLLFLCESHWVTGGGKWKKNNNNNRPFNNWCTATTGALHYIHRMISCFGTPPPPPPLLPLSSSAPIQSFSHFPLHPSHPSSFFLSSTPLSLPPSSPRQSHTRARKDTPTVFFHLSSHLVAISCSLHRLFFPLSHQPLVAFERTPSWQRKSTMGKPNLLTLIKSTQQAQTDPSNRQLPSR